MRLFVFITLLCLSLPFSGWAVNVMVNEIHNGSGAIGAGTKMARDEYIEFVIVEQATAADLASLTFGDSNDTTSQIQSVFHFDQATLQTALNNSSVSAFQAGTIIVVKGSGLGAQNLTYNPLSNNIGNADAWSIELVAGQGALDHPETLINGNMTFGNNGEVVWISTSNPPTRNNDTSGFISAIGYDSNPGTIANAVISQFGSENILQTTVATGRSVSNVGNTTESLVVSTTSTMGTSNGGANDTWIIGGLRTNAALSLAPEPARIGLIALGSASMLLRRRRTDKGGAHV